MVKDKEAQAYNEIRKYFYIIGDNNRIFLMQEYLKSGFDKEDFLFSFTDFYKEKNIENDITYIWNMEKLVDQYILFCDMKQNSSYLDV